MHNTVRKAIWIGLFLRLFVAIWNGFFGPSFGADNDAVGFHLMAVAYSQDLLLDKFVIGHFYSYALGVIYFLIDDSLFLGSFLSVLAWLSSAVLLSKIMHRFSIDKSHQSKAMLIYALLPSSIVYTSVTLREVFQLFFVNLAFYSIIKIYLDKSAKHWTVLCCAVIGMGVLHGALIAFGIFVVAATLSLILLRRRNGYSLIKLALAAPLVALIVFFGISFFNNFSYKLDDGLAVAVEAYQKGSLGTDSRANYKDNVDIGGVTGLLIFIPFSLLQYLFEPMPWRITAAIDVVTLLENSLRVWLILKAFVSMRNISHEGRKLLVFIFFSYIVIETIWSLGTINWGTAMRHHLPSIGLLLVSAFSYSTNKAISQIQSRGAKPVKSSDLSSLTSELHK